MIPAAVANTTNCQAPNINHDSGRLATGWSVSRGTAQCSAPRKAFARKPYATALVWIIRHRPGASNSTPLSGFQ